VKPKLFVGSSSEAIKLARAIHENLMHDVHVTVWNEGIFKVSEPSVDSILDQLAEMDFGAFVFAPDDELLIRGEESEATRDNVIFELGLFVGRLGRQRSFIFLPTDNRNLRVPSDLLGVTPALYESDRSEHEPVSATSVACSQVLRRITELWSGGEPEPASSKPEEEKTVERRSVGASEGREGTDQEDKDEEDGPWSRAYVAKDYEKALSLLQKEINDANESEKHRLELWLGSVKAKLDFDDGVQYIERKIEENPENDLGYLILSWTYEDEELYDEGLAALESGLQAASQKSSLMWFKGHLLQRIGDTEEAKIVLQQLTDDEPKYAEAYTALASTLNEEEADKAKEVYESGLKKLPKNETLLDAYAKLLMNLDEPASALPVFKKLVALRPDNPTHLTMLGNVYLRLNLDGLALQAYYEANEIAEEKEGWILGNIGNLYNNKDLHPRAIEFLKRALRLDPDSGYAADRLAKAIKGDKEEREKESKIIREQRIAARQREQAVSAPEESETEESPPEESA
jgi:tetratricopeptide (TPR) repeat protein